MSNPSNFYIENGILSRYWGPGGDVEIPAGVTAIGKDAWHGVFQNNTKLESVVIPEGVEAIGNLTFDSCVNLKAISLPSTLKSIGRGAFQNCRALVSISLPGSLMTIGDYAFSNCGALEEVSLPETLKETSSSMFSGCRKLDRITLPEGLEKLGKFTFSYCESLKEVNGLREDVAIGDGAFLGCGGMADEAGFTVIRKVLYGYAGKETDLALPAGITELSPALFARNSELISVTIPEGVKKIAFNAFAYCGKLETVTFPEGLEEIGEGAFSNCESLKKIHLPDSTRIIESDAFNRCAMLEEVRLPAQLEVIQPRTFGRCTALREIVIPEGVHTIREYAFSGCTALTFVHLPQTMKTIMAAFGECTALEEIAIPDGVEFLYGFAECTNLKNIQLPRALKAASGEAFTGCKKILFLRVPAAAEAAQTPYPKEILILVEKIFPDFAAVQKSGFCNGSSVLISVGSGDKADVKLMLNKKFEDLKVFDKKGNFNWKIYDNLLVGNECKLPSPLLAFAMLCRLRWDQELAEDKKQYYTEYVCKNIKKAALYCNLNPEDGLIATLEEIGALTAKNKKSLLPLMGIGEAPAPKAKKEVQSVAADGTKTPAQLRKEWNTKKLEDGTLKLTSYKGTDTVLEVPAMIGKDRVTVVGKECVTGCTWGRATSEQLTARKKITEVTIPEGIEVIEEEAFRQCDGLRKVVLPATLKVIGERAFSGCGSLTSIQVPEGTDVGTGAFRSCSSLADEQGLVICGGVLFDGYKGGDIVIPGHVARVETGSVFNKIADLRSVTFPNGIKSLEQTFSGCDALQSVTIPPSVSYISRLHDGKQVVRVLGYTGSEAERYVTEISSRTWQSMGQVSFESIGICEKVEFEIENGVLIKYNGDKQELEHAAIPEGVTRIESNIFYGCKKLKTIDFPDTLVHVNSYYAFKDTPWLDQQTEGPVYAGRVLLMVVSTEEKPVQELIVREGTVEIADNACWGIKTLTKVVLPDGLKRIGGGAFGFCLNLEEMVVTNSVADIGDGAFEYLNPMKRCTGGVLRQNTKLSAKFKVFYAGDPEDTAWLTFYQAEQSWRKAVRAKMDEVPEQIGPAITKMAQLIDGMEALDKTVGNRAAAFAQELCRGAGAEPLQALYQALKKKDHPAVKKLDLDDTFRECMEGGKQEDLSKLHPVEAMVVQKLQYTPAFEKVEGRIVEGVRYVDSGEICANRVLAFIVYEYVRQYDPESVKYVSMYATACTPYSWSAEADQAAAALDRQALQEALLQLAEQYGNEYWLPYARYADDRHVVALLSQMREWDTWWKYAATGRKHIMIARSGLLLNDTKAAMIHLDKVGRLETYAAMRDTDADTIRDTVLADFGFDENREIRYDLGGNTVIIRMAQELSLSIFDTNAGKTVKSIPRKGADTELYEKAKTAFSDLKKNIKKVITNRKKALFADFLSGSKKDAEKWKQSYMSNPVLNSVARLLVWDQGGKTFTLTVDGAVDSSGTAYVITDEPICVAHPIEMRSEISTWQEYFAAHGLKQPFEQIWEPAYEPEEILPERYIGSKLNVYRLSNKEQHGITVWGLRDYSEDYGFELKDCQMEQDASEWRFVHGITDDAAFALGRFTFETFTRQVNHIVYLFDKWTAADRIEKDDVSVADLLHAFTAAQIRMFVDLANQKGCTNCASLLLDYQNRKFGAFDPMAEFTLDL